MNENPNDILLDYFNLNSKWMKISLVRFCTLLLRSTFFIQIICQYQLFSLYLKPNQKCVLIPFWYSQFFFLERFQIWYGLFLIHKKDKVCMKISFYQIANILFIVVKWSRWSWMDHSWRKDERKYTSVSMKYN